MKAAFYDTFKGPITVQELPDPEPGPDDVIIAVKATGLCRSDWHGWQGLDSDVKLPHVPGREFAGVIASTGANIRNWKAGDRVTTPFCLGCATCPTC
jgi:alcohol dehydrogenase